MPARTHGMTAGKYNAKNYPRIYGIWKNMKQRCFNPNNPHYENYGGRGVTVCDRWLSFENFLSDMGECPAGMSLDRINNDKGYSKENCRWADATVQARNSRRAKLVTIKGETMCIAEWLGRAGVSYTTFKKRMSKYKWPLHEALTTPAIKWERK